MPLGVEVGLDLGAIVLDGDPRRAHPHPIFWPMSIVAKRLDGCLDLMKMHALGTEVDLDLGHIVLDGDPAYPPEKEAQQPPPNFQPMSIVATVANLSYC